MEDAPLPGVASERLLIDLRYPEESWFADGSAVVNLMFVGCFLSEDAVRVGELQCQVLQGRLPSKGASTLKLGGCFHIVEDTQVRQVEVVQ